MDKWKIVSFAYTTLLLGVTQPSLANVQTMNLVVSQKSVNFTGKASTAIAVNDQIPAPTLHFKEGDEVNINVYNKLKVGTTIHWHGLLVPWQMDGVSGITQKNIPPGGVFHYQFKLYQSGTYWYHAHAGFQEQEGLYGAIIIDPAHPLHKDYNKDYTIVLSDWSNTKAQQIFKNLKKRGEYYSSEFPLQPTLLKFIKDYRSGSIQQKSKLIHDYKMMQKMRMSIYDISDVAYDAFLLNGSTKHHPWTAIIKKGDKVRLRFIGASASTIYHVKIPGALLKIVQKDGNNVAPYSVRDFTIAPGETYDVIVHIEKSSPYVIYAESADTLGVAIGGLVNSANQKINFKQILPFPEPEPITMQHEVKYPLAQHKTHQHHKPESIIPLSSGTQYQSILSPTKTNDPDFPIEKIIKMDLSGYMDHYIWFINGVPEFHANPILLKQNKRYRFVFTNNSMMHHPMHIHGHWFIFRNGHGDHDPLFHTIDVPPHATVVADINTDASGQWFFHCHHLYHMMAGMARVFQYETLLEVEKGNLKPQNLSKKLPLKNQAIIRVDEHFPIDHSLLKHPSEHPPYFYMANFIDGNIDPFNSQQQISFKGLYGNDYNKLELFANEIEIHKGSVENADLDIFYWRLIDQFWVLKGGVNYVYRPGKHPYWQPGVGIEGLMKYFIDTDIRLYYYNGSAKLDMEFSRDTQITHRFFIKTRVRGIFASKTLRKNEVGSGLNTLEFTIRTRFQLNPVFSLYLQYQHTGHYSSLRRLLINDNQPIINNAYSIGFTLLI